MRIVRGRLMKIGSAVLVEIYWIRVCIYVENLLSMESHSEIYTIEFCANFPINVMHVGDFRWERRKKAESN